MLDNPFWNYSWSHYSRPEVASLCLNYQYQAGANVNILLFCCWLGSLDLGISQLELDEIKELIGDWDQQAVQPLRASRHFISGSALATDTLIDMLKEAELASEQIVQTVLFKWYLAKKKCSINSSDRENKGNIYLQVDNLNCYLTSLGCDTVTIDSPLVWSTFIS